MSDTRPDLAAIKARAVLAFPSRADIGDAPELVPCGGEQEIVAATGPGVEGAAIWACPHALEVERLTAERDALRAAVEQVEALIESWNRKGGPESKAWAVYGRQVMSVPWAVSALRAALTPDAET